MGGKKMRLEVVEPPESAYPVDDDGTGDEDMYEDGDDPGDEDQDAPGDEDQDGQGKKRKDFSVKFSGRNITGKSSGGEKNAGIVSLADFQKKKKK
ncbi:MAG: hypothetical protein HQK66_10775 [Desulfamplus sp.]|nr:hypothetical protein [Desulfamplus sp.]